MTKKEKQDLDVSIAARLSNRFRLRDVVCIGLEAKHLRSDPLPDHFALSWDAPKVQIVWHRDEHGMKAIVPLTVFIELASDEDSPSADATPRAKLAEVSVALRLDYDIGEGDALVDDDVRNYVGITCYMHAWPYFRADVQWLTAKLGFPPLVLPVIVSGHAEKRVIVRHISEINDTRQALMDPS